MSMAKCRVCSQTIETTFLGKLIGTTIRKDKKQHTVCSKCQKKLHEQDIKDHL